MKLPESIGEAVSNLGPAQLHELLVDLSDEVMKLAKDVAAKEVAVRISTGKYKAAQARASFLLKGTASPSVVKLIVEGNEEVATARDVLIGDEAMHTMAKAELEGRTAQYQGIKKLIDLKVEEIRAFKAGNR